MEELIRNTVIQAIQQAASNGLLVGAGPSMTPAGSPWRSLEGIAEYLGFSTNWVRQKMMHLSHRPGGSDPRWNIHEVDAWVKENHPVQHEEATATAVPGPVMLPGRKRRAQRRSA